MRLSPMLFAAVLLGGCAEPDRLPASGWAAEGAGTRDQRERAARSAPGIAGEPDHRRGYDDHS